MKDGKYFIEVDKVIRGVKTKAYYANDSRSGGYPYFNENIICDEVQSFNTVEDAIEFLKKEYVSYNGGYSFKGFYEGDILGRPRIVKLVFNVETAYLY